MRDRTGRRRLPRLPRRRAPRSQARERSSLPPLDLPLSLTILHPQVLYRSPPGQNGAGHDDCVVSDFGLAVEIKPEQKLHVIAGSAGYSAPEMYSSDGYGFPADCWSLG